MIGSTSELDRLLLLQHGTADLEVVVSRRNFGTEVPAFLNDIRYLNPQELLLVSNINYFFDSKRRELPPTIKTQLMLDFIVNRRAIISVHELVQESEDLLKHEGVLGGGEERKEMDSESH